jgi:hypothetical protein
MLLSELLAPHLKAVRAIIDAADDDYAKHYAAEAKIAHDASCKAHCKQRHMLTRALGYAAANDATVKPFKSKNLQGIIIDQRAALIFKKLDSTRRPSNHVSQQIEDYQHQRDILGIPAPIKLIAGYQEDDETGAVLGIFLVRPSGGTNRWELRLDGEEVTKVGSQPLFPDDDDDEIGEADILPRTEPGKVIPIERGRKDGED